MTLRELYDHYAQFQPDALDAQLAIEHENDFVVPTDHSFAADINRIYLEVITENDY